VVDIRNNGVLDFHGVYLEWVDGLTIPFPVCLMLGLALRLSDIDMVPVTKQRIFFGMNRDFRVVTV
jgi:hypothetical protein